MYSTFIINNGSLIIKVTPRTFKIALLWNIAYSELRLFNIFHAFHKWIYVPRFCLKHISMLKLLVHAKTTS